MTEPISHNTSPREAAISRRAIVRSLIVASVLAMGVVSVRGLETALHATFNKPPAPLQQPLPNMRKELGSPVRYEAIGSDEILDAEVIETLGTTDYLLRQYCDQTLPGAGSRRAGHLEFELLSDRQQHSARAGNMLGGERPR